MVNNMTDLTAQEPAWQTRDHLDDPVIGELRNRFGPDAFTVQATRTGVPVVWIKREQLLEVGDFLKKLPKPYVMLFDLHGMDERLRTHREGLPAADFSVFYHLISIDRNRDIMLKVALAENDLHVPTFTKLFPNANWYERETWDRSCRSSAVLLVSSVSSVKVSKDQAVSSKKALWQWAHWAWRWSV